MLPILLFVLGLGSAATPALPTADDGPPTLIVQVVDRFTSLFQRVTSPSNLSREKALRNPLTSTKTVTPNSGWNRESNISSKQDRPAETRYSYRPRSNQTPPKEGSFAK